MADKRVVFTFNRAPFGSVYYTEGLRAAVGVISGIDEHQVDLIYLGEGVRFALKGVDRSDTAMYLNTLADYGYKLKVERESLTGLGIPESELASDAEVISRSQVLELIKNADLTIDM